MPELYSICDHCHQKSIVRDMTALKCESCGAPLKAFHRFEKSEPAPVVVERIVEREVIKEVKVETPKASKKSGKSKKKKKKSGLKRFADLAEDIFDIFD